MSLDPLRDNNQPPKDAGKTPTERRHEQLREAFFIPIERTIEVGRQEQPGLINLIASYDDKCPASEPLARQNTLANHVQILAAQLRHLPSRVRENFHIVIANNGMSSSQLVSIRGVVDSINNKLRQAEEPEIKLHIVHAPKDPSDPKTQTAAYSRNHGGSFIRQKRLDDPRFASPILIGDDDSFPLGVAGLLNVLAKGCGKIGAVAPLNRNTDNVILKGDAALAELDAGHHSPSQNPSFRNFPGIMDNHGKINFCLLTAFGGSRVPKTCSLLLDGYAVQTMQDSKGDLFLVCPEGSFEDMMLSARLEQQGYDLVECQDAQVYDQVRVNPRARAFQQFRWASDHASAYHDFILVGRREKQPLVFEGISVLIPAYDRWMLRNISADEPGVTQPLNTRRICASIVNPAEVLELLSRIELSVAQDPDAFMAKYPYAFEGREGSFRDIDVLKKTVALSTKLIQTIAPCMPRVPSDDVHVPVLSREQLDGPDQLRFEDDVRVARLLGNLAAMATMTSNDIEGGKLRVALLGPRQATR